MVKTNTVGWAIVGAFAIWWLLGSGKGIEYTQRIGYMLKLDRLLEKPSETPPYTITPEYYNR